MIVPTFAGAETIFTTETTKWKLDLMGHYFSIIHVPPKKIISKQQEPCQCTDIVFESLPAALEARHLKVAFFDGGTTSVLILVRVDESG